MKVCVDTKAPTVTMRWLQPQKGMVGVEWECAMRTLIPRLCGWTIVRWAATGFRCRSSKRPSAHITGTLATTNPLKAHPDSGQGPQPGPIQAVRQRRIQDRHDAARAAGVGADAVLQRGRPGVTMVNTKDVSSWTSTFRTWVRLKVKSVEVWYTQDDRTWTKLPEDAPPKPPYTVKLPGEGGTASRLSPAAASASACRLRRPATRLSMGGGGSTKPEVKNLGVEVGRVKTSAL